MTNNDALPPIIIVGDTSFCLRRLWLMIVDGGTNDVVAYILRPRKEAAQSTDSVACSVKSNIHEFIEEDGRWS